MANNDQIIQLLTSMNNQLVDHGKELQAINIKLANLTQVQEKQGEDIIRLEQGQKQLIQTQKRLENGQAHINSAVEALQAGQEDLVEHVRKNVATKLDVDIVEKSLKSDIYELHAKVVTIDAKLVRKVQNHEKRLDDAGIPNPDKH